MLQPEKSRPRRDKTTGSRRVFNPTSAAPGSTRQDYFVPSTISNLAAVVGLAEMKIGPASSPRAVKRPRIPVTAGVKWPVSTAANQLSEKKAFKYCQISTIK
jgi:hypothetical protein